MRTEYVIYKPTTTHTHSTLCKPTGRFQVWGVGGCFKIECELQDHKELLFCIICRHELLGESITNSLDCPLLTSTTTLQVLPTSFITCSASIIHECGPSCNFTTTLQTVSREREHLDVSQLTYVHDYSITTFCLNVYTNVLITSLYIHYVNSSYISSKYYHLG